ncbi:MAG: hypothetical protein M3Q95_01780 [Bacteroidota bacterium]|nr:hypothetical protein [Bacteroidota bacterium]
MIQIAPADPILRKIVLPSVIRISDAWTGKLLTRTPGKIPSGTSSTSRLRFEVQLKLKL